MSGSVGSGPMSESKLYAAFIKAQAEIKGAVKDSNNPFFKSKYADLAACFDAIKEQFAANGLGVIQLPRVVDGELRVATRIIHSSGEFIEDDGVPVRPTKNDPQGMGSAMTYARRYGLTAMAGLPQIDDDGNAASQPVKQKEMSENQAREIADLLDDANVQRLEDGTLDMHEGVEEFASTWIKLDAEDQKAFGPWFSKFYPNRVSAMKAHMRDVLDAYRELMRKAA